jgi:imidazolonepropionase-like amidohydrolase
MRRTAPVFALALALAPLGEATAQSAVAITARRVLDGTGRSIPGAFVIVERGRITSVGPRPASFTGPVYDLGDATVLPGLVEEPTH